MTETLTPHAELRLYIDNRPAWRRYVAGRLAGKLMAMTDEHLSRSWSYLDRDTQREVWQHLTEAQRERVRKLRADAQEENHA